MRFLCIGDEMMHTALAWRLHVEGNEVKCFIGKPKYRKKLDGMVAKAPSLLAGLAWVGKDGVVISDDETDVSDIRRRGYRVVGGNLWIKRLENDRAFQNQIAKQAGVRTPDFHKMTDINEAIKFVKDNPDAYVLKQMGHAPKCYNFVGKEDDGSDVVLQLVWIKQSPAFQKLGKLPFALQEVVDGLEFGVTGWWSYDHWLTLDGDTPLMQVDREHKKSRDGDIGMSCGEMGTAAKYCQTKLFKEMLLPFTPILEKFASDVAITVNANCGICEEDGEIRAYLFEVTARLGYPSTSIEMSLMNTEAGHFYHALATGQGGGFEVKPGWGVVTVLGAGVFPSETVEDDDGDNFAEQPIEIPQLMGNEPDLDCHPSDIYYDEKIDQFRFAGDYFEVCNVTADAKTIKEANTTCVNAMQKVTVRAPVYRHDIGEKFENDELPQLIDWGYLDK